VAPPQVPGYALIAPVGEGGFGEVWRATRDRDGHSVAIKLLHVELVRSSDAMARFARELDAINRIDHRCVVKALGHGAIDLRPYIVMEYVAGDNLRGVLAERKRLPAAEMFAIIEPICDALAAAHTAGFVHRDVKPSNIIVTRDAAGVRPVLLDFGLVKLLDDPGATLTSSRGMLGTPAAMAPEQINGRTIGPHTDVYALGLLAYHMLTGVPAFGGVPGAMQLYLQEHGPRPRPSAQAAVDPALDPPIAAALDPDPATRTATVSALCAQLRAIVGAMP
jgi:serine/threonine protein kinase